ncbi:putative ribonuclease H-like domain-containing protein [Tanacetum coccineum]
MVIASRSDMAEEQAQTNMDLMAFSDSKNEVLISEEVAVLKREVACKDYEISVLKTEFEKVKQEKEDASKENSDDSLVKEQVSEDTSSFVESSLNVDKETIFLDKKIEFVKPKNHEKPVKKSVRVNYNYTTNRTHPNAQRNKVPRAVLMKTSLKPFNTVRTVNIAHPKSIVFSAKPMSHFSKSAQSTWMLKAIMTGNIVLYSRLSMKFDGGYIKFGEEHMVVEFLLPDESQILLKIPRKDNMYSFDMKNIVPKEILTCLVAKATSDKSMLWHRRLGYINFKNINKLVKDNLASQKEVGTLRYLSLVVPLKKVGDEAVHKELGDRMERAATTASSLEAEQESVTAAELLTTVRNNLVLPVQVNAAEGDFINTSIQGFI